jgi:hypothetical protein
MPKQQIVCFFCTSVGEKCGTAHSSLFILSREGKYLQKQVKFWRETYPEVTVALLCRTNEEVEKMLSQYIEPQTTHANNNNSVVRVDNIKLTVSTIHKAKGLEYDVVYIFGANPIHWQEENEEERRLMYVALSRARFMVHVVYSVEAGTVPPLRYIAEMFQEHSANHSSNHNSSVAPFIVYGSEVSQYDVLCGRLFAKSYSSLFSTVNKL